MNAFYDDLARQTEFADMADADQFTDVPDDWIVGVSDIVDSTGAISAGRYKTVNMVGAATISAMMNALQGRAFPFIFGGDGAGFAVWPDARDTAAEALAAVQVWAQEEFGLTVRAALSSVAECRAAGHAVRVARFQVSEGADYAMFGGGGLAWADAQMKTGRFAVAPAGAGTRPDLTGLSCRWSHMPARNGTILSLLVLPRDGSDPEAFAAAARDVLAEVRGLDRDGHPSPLQGPGSSWPPAGATLEAHAAKGAGSLGAARRKALMESLVAWLLIRTGLKPGGFDARRYARVVGENADFRKFDDGLKMTIDCDAATKARIVARLDAASEAGILRYGLSEQDEAMMTCIVPSFLRDDHVHFIDGAAGGYTAAATQMKSGS